MNPNIVIYDNVITSTKKLDYNARCNRCDHSAQHHFKDGCDWNFMQDHHENLCPCHLTMYDVITQNDKIKSKKLNYTFDLLS